MSAAGHDDARAAAALIACAAARRRWPRSKIRRLQRVLLGADPAADRAAAIAVILAVWLAATLDQAGVDPRAFALDVIAESIAAESEADAP